MEDNLVGYLLNALDDDTRQKVQEHLRTHPDAPRRLELLRRALEPLTADAAPPEPPPDLCERTLARFEGLKHRPLPLAPRTLTPRTGLGGRAWWRRSDVLVAATLLLALLSLLPSGVLSLQRRRDRLHCQNNLRAFHQALMRYCDLNQDELPRVEAQPPRNFAGVFVPHLRDAGLLEPGTLSAEPLVNCAAANSQAPSPKSLKELEDLHRLRPEEFAHHARQTAGGYAYTLGYRNVNGQLHGLRREAGSDHVPVMADRPPFVQHPVCGLSDNSRNHGGTGQNVLHLGGHVQFYTQRTIGNDDIFLNGHNQVAAGLSSRDSVLGSSGAQPIPATADVD